MPGINEIYPGLGGQEAMLARTLAQQPGYSQPAYYQPLGYPDSTTYNQQVLGNGYGQDVYAGRTLAQYQNQGGHGGSGGGGGTGIGVVDAAGNFAGSYIAASMVPGALLAMNQEYFAKKSPNGLAGKLQGHIDKANQSIAGVFSGRGGDFHHPGVEEEAVNKYIQRLEKRQLGFATAYRNMQENVIHQAGMNVDQEAKAYNDLRDEALKTNPAKQQRYTELTDEIRKTHQSAIKASPFADEAEQLQNELDDLTGQKKLDGLNKRREQLSFEQEIQKSEQAKQAASKLKAGCTSGSADYLKYEALENAHETKLTQMRQQAGNNATAISNLDTEISTTKGKVQANKIKNAKAITEAQTKLRDIESQVMSDPSNVKAKKLNRLLADQQQVIEDAVDLHDNKNAGFKKKFNGAREQHNLTRDSVYEAAEKTKQGKKYVRKDIAHRKNSLNPEVLENIKTGTARERDLIKQLEKAKKPHKIKELQEQLAEQRKANNKFFQRVAGKEVKAKGAGILGWCNKLLKSKNIFSKILGFAGKALALDNPVGIAITLGIMAYQYFSSRSQNAHQFGGSSNFDGGGAGGHY